MTTTLETFTDRKIAPINGECRVYYRVLYGNGTKEPKVSAIDVSIKSAKEDPHRFAELLTIKHILLHTGLMGDNRTGDNMAINVSSGVIKKIQKKHTSNVDTIKHGAFLQIRFSTAAISVARKFEWVDGFSGPATSMTPGDCLDKPIKTHMGELHITRHAVERFMERVSSNNIDKAWRKLSKLLVSADWTNKIPVRPLRDGRVARTTETWSLSRLGCASVDIVIIRNSNQNRIVTVLTS